MVENYMDYGYDQCVSAFTEGQRTRMRNALLGYRASLLESDGLVPVAAQDAGIASLQGLAPIGCNATHDIDVSLQNFGTEAMTEATIHFSLDGGSPLSVLWSGELEAGMSTLVPLPALAAGEGAHTLTAWTSIAADEYAPNDTLTMDFEVVPGTWLTMEIQFDFLPHGISWEVENTDLGMVVLEGGDYFNDEYASQFIEIEGCASDGCYTLTVEDLFGNGMHYSPPGWYALSDSEANILGEGSGNFGAEQTHEFCIEGSSVEPCPDANENGVCDDEEDELYDSVPGCTDETACNYDDNATEEDGNCEYAAEGYDCDGNPLVSSVGTLDAGPTLSAFPNPCVGGVFRVGGLPGPGPHPLAILDMNGRVVHGERAEATSTAAGWTLQPDILLKTGAYLVRIGEARASRTVRVLVN